MCCFDWKIHATMGLGVCSKNGLKAPKAVQCVISCICTNFSAAPLIERSRMRELGSKQDSGRDFNYAHKIRKRRASCPTESIQTLRSDRKLLPEFWHISKPNAHRPHADISATSEGNRIGGLARGGSDLALKAGATGGESWRKLRKAEGKPPQHLPSYYLRSGCSKSDPEPQFDFNMHHVFPWLFRSLSMPV